MATFLKIVSLIYLVLVWATFALMMAVPIPTPGPVTGGPVIFGIAVVLSVPAAVLFAFGQVVGDVRAMRNLAHIQTDHLEAMRAYYEPDERQRGPRG